MNSISYYYYYYIMCTPFW